MATFNGTPDGDIFTGGSDADVANGNDGNDALSGGGGSDSLAGGAGADVLTGGDGDDALYAGSAVPGFSYPYNINEAGAQYLDRGTEVDTLVGGDGSDFLFAGYGDNVDGGTNGSYGDYLYISFAGAAAGVTADFRLTTQVIGGGTITGIENLTWIEGSNFADNINAEAPSNGYSRFTVVHGLGGDDILTAGYYTGYLYGDEGNDTVDGRGSQYLFSVEGGAGDDTLYTNANTFSSAYGGDGNDVMYTHGATFGGAGDDLIILQETYYAGLVFGEQGNDEIRAAARGSVISGGAGADHLIGSSGVDILASVDFKTNPDGYPTDKPADDMAMDHDVLSGGGGNDILAAGYGDDVDGGSGADVLRFSLGGYGSGLVFSTAGIVSGQPFALGAGTIQNVETLEYLRGTNFADIITVATQSSLLTVDAADGDDVVYSNSSSISLLGGAGDDRLVSGAAGDIFDGGAGADTIDYSLATAGVSVDLTAGTGGGGDALSNVENVVGGAFNDTILGSVGANVLEGGLGDDTLNGREGADTAAYANAGAGVTVRLSQTGPQATGSAGSDTLISIENLTGSAFADTLSGDAGNNVLSGLGGDDVLEGGAGDDTLDGGAGVDTASYAAAMAGVTVSLGVTAAQNTVAAGSDTLVSIENLIGSAFNDTLTGDGSANIFDGGLGDDVLDGGAGSDTVNYASATGAVNVNLRQGKATGAAGNDTLVSIQAIVGSAYADSLTSAADSGGSVLRGMGGDDVFYFGAAAPSAATPDTFDGGDGMDMLSFENASGAVTATLGASVSSAWNSANLVSVEGLAGSAYDDVLAGDIGANVLMGGAGADTLNGGAGADRLYGGVGDDVYVVDSQADLVFEVAAEGTDTVIATANFYLYDNIENLTLASGAGDIFGVGNGLANTITGNAGANLLLGGGGNDTLGGLGGDDRLYGEDGNDVLTGGSGSDWLVGGAGDDTLDGATGGSGEQDLLFGGAGNDSYLVDAANDFTFEDAGGGTDTVTADFAGGTYYLYGNVENLTLAGTTLYGVGNELDNVLVGSASGNWLLGGAGNDTLNGKAGGDVLFGQGGADTFVFERGTGGDVIGDFAVGVDKVKLAGIYSSFAEVQSHMVQNGTDSAIVIGDGDLVVFQNVAMSAFSAGDFLF